MGGPTRSLALASIALWVTGVCKSPHYNKAVVLEDVTVPMFSHLNNITSDKDLPSQWDTKPLF
jgi:hypothetical protein